MGQASTTDTGAARLRRRIIASLQTAAARHGWPLHVIEDAADDPAVEQPQAFLATLREILTGVAAAGTGEVRA